MGVGGPDLSIASAVTYPAQKLSGSMVSGIPPWYFDERSVYPEGLLDRLKHEGYEVDTPMSRALEKQPDEMVSRLLATEGRRVDLFLDLLKEGDWSFGMIVLTALDRLQHKTVGKGKREDEAVRRAAFRAALVLIARRIELMLALPLEKLERLALEARVRAIGGAR